MEQYLTVKELSERLKLARQTIYGWTLFKWSAMKNWLEGDGFDDEKISFRSDFVFENQQIPPLNNQPSSCIKI